MTATMLLWLVCTVAIGILLLVWGLRGKRLNDHPVCRQCRFDLFGQPQGTITCPECGAGLKRPGFVRIGQRRKRPIAIIVGAIAVCLPLTVVGVMVFAMLTGADVNSYKPLGLLRWEARTAPAARAKLIGAEILRRVRDKATSPQQYTRLVQTALDYQGDPRRPWSVEWGDVIEQADSDNKLDKEDRMRYHRQAPVLELKARPRVRLGDAVPLIVSLKESRIGSTATLLGMCHFEERTINGETARRAAEKVPGFDMMPMENDGPSGMFQLYGPGSRWGMGQSMGEAAIRLRIPEDVKPGRAKVHIAVAIDVQDQSAFTGTYTWANLVQKDNPSVHRFASDVDVEVLPKEGASIELVTPTADMTQKLQRLLEPTGCQLLDYGVGPVDSQVMMNFNIDGRPVDFAFDVFLKSADREWPAGVLTSGRYASSQNQWPGMDKGRMVNATASGFKGGNVDVILRPSGSVASSTLDLAQIYNGEIVFKDVEFQKQSISGGGWVRAATTSVGSSTSGSSPSLFSSILRALGF